MRCFPWSTMVICTAWRYLCICDAVLVFGLGPHFVFEVHAVSHDFNSHAVSDLRGRESKKAKERKQGYTSLYSINVNASIYQEVSICFGSMSAVIVCTGYRIRVNRTV